MKITIKVNRDDFWGKRYLAVYQLIVNNKWRWQAVSAVLACGGGLIAPLFALFLDLLVSYTGLSYEKPFLSKVSTVLYIISVPLLLLGAHFLDLLDRCEISVSEENFIDPAIGNLGLPAKAEDF